MTMAQGYDVTDTRQVSAMGVDGRFHDQLEVTYITKDGHTGSIRVRKDQADPKVIHDMIAAEVATIAAIRNHP